VRPSVKGKRKIFFWMGIGLFVVMIMGFCLFGGSAAAQSEPRAIEAGGETIPALWWLAPIGAIFGLIAAIFFYRGMKKESEGTKEMQEIAQGVREGAIAYLKRQYKVVAIVLVVLALIFAYLAFGLSVPIMNQWVPFAFLTGGFFSGLCGWLGMKTATYANARTANAARTSLDKALKVAFRSGAVMGLIVVGFGLLDICLWFLILSNVGDYSLTEITVTMLVPTSWVRWRLVFLRTTREIRRCWQIMSAIMSVTLPVWALTFTNHTAVPFYHQPYSVYQPV
jgi:hypothetical protein